MPGILRNDDDGKDLVVGTQQSHAVNCKSIARRDFFARCKNTSDARPFMLSGDNLGNKRKIDANANATNDEPIAKRSNTFEIIDMTDDSSVKSMPNIIVSGGGGGGVGSANMAAGATTSNAANLYAKLAASLLEDEDMEIDDTITTQMVPAVAQPAPQPTIMQQQTMVSASSAVTLEPKPVITVPMQRQIIMSPNPTQMILAQGASNQAMGQPTTATIKTESGYQTVYLQQPNQMGNIQIQKQMMQPVMQQQQQQTQYVLATNQQGQTYLVAQQQPPPVNQIVLQTSQQQGNTPTKTIIILQQQAPNNTPSNQHPLLQNVSSSGTQQKVIMTTQQGQQMIVTQGNYYQYYYTVVAWAFHSSDDI